MISFKFWLNPLLPMLLVVGCQLFGQQNNQQNNQQNDQNVEQNLPKNINDEIKHVVNQNRTFKKMARSFLNLSNLRQLYELRNFEAIWFDNNRLNSMGREFITVLKDPEIFGIRKNEFWDNEVEAIIEKVNQLKDHHESTLWYELYFSDLAIKFSKTISQGHVFDPNVYDSEIKYKRNEFKKYPILNTILSGESSQLRTNFSLLEPHNRVYLNIKKALGEFLERVQLLEKTQPSSQQVNQPPNAWKKIEIAESDRVILELCAKIARIS